MAAYPCHWGNSDDEVFFHLVVFAVSCFEHDISYAQVRAGLDQNHGVGGWFNMCTVLDISTPFPILVDTVVRRPPAFFFL